MNNARLLKAQHEFYCSLTKNCSLAITLQTGLGTLNTSNSKREWMAEKARAEMYKFVPRLNKLLTGNGYRRNSAYLPVIVTALHGQSNSYDKGRTLHYHLAVGNYDKQRVQAPEFAQHLRRLWLETEIGADDIDVRSIYDTASWARYIGREMLDGNAGSIDIETTQIPTHLLCV